MQLQPDTETGDIVFVLQLKDHPKFKRKGDDLFVQHTLTLTEALCGFQFPLTHLDGRQLLIKSNPGDIIKPGVYTWHSLLLRKLLDTFCSWGLPKDTLVLRLGLSKNFIFSLDKETGLSKMTDDEIQSLSLWGTLGFESGCFLCFLT